MEVTTEVCIVEDFSTWSERDKFYLIKAIIEEKTWEFIGTDTVDIDPIDRVHESP